MKPFARVQRSRSLSMETLARSSTSPVTSQLTSPSICQFQARRSKGKASFGTNNIFGWIDVWHFNSTTSPKISFSRSSVPHPEIRRVRTLYSNKRKSAHQRVGTAILKEGSQANSRSLGCGVEFSAVQRLPEYSCSKAHSTGFTRSCHYITPGKAVNYVSVDVVIVHMRICAISDYTAHQRIAMLCHPCPNSI